MRVQNELKDESRACFTDSRCVDSDGMGICSVELFKRGYAQPSGIDQTATKSIAKALCGFWISTVLARTDLVRKI